MRVALLTRPGRCALTRLKPDEVRLLQSRISRTALHRLRVAGDVSLRALRGLVARLRIFSRTLALAWLRALSLLSLTLRPRLRSAALRR